MKLSASAPKGEGLTEKCRRMQLEAATEQEQRFLAKLFDVLVDGGSVITLNAEGVQTCKYDVPFNKGKRKEPVSS
jgi:hypothetical protein